MMLFLCNNLVFSENRESLVCAVETIYLVCFVHICDYSRCSLGLWRKIVGEIVTVETFLKVCEA